MNMRHVFMYFFIGMNYKSVASFVVNGCAADIKVGKFQVIRSKIVKNLSF